MDFGFWILGFGLWIWGFGLWILGCVLYRQSFLVIAEEERLQRLHPAVIYLSGSLFDRGPLRD